MNTISSLVQEKDFPNQSARLQQLICDYSKENIVPKTQSIMTNLVTNIEVSNDVEIRKFKHLNPEQQHEILSRIKGIDYLNPSHILTFGSSKENLLSKHAEIIISKHTLPGSTYKMEWGILSNLREFDTFGNSKRKLYKALEKYETITKKLLAVEVELKKQQISMQKDINLYEQMYKSTMEQLDDFEFDCIALQIMCYDAQKKLDSIKSKGKLDFMKLNKANNLQDAIDRIEGRIHTIQTTRVSMLQSAIQLTALIKTDQIICEKIAEIEKVIIPLWTWQHAIAIKALKTTESHEEVSIAIEDLAIIQDYIDDMIITVNKTSQNVSSKCIESMKTLLFF